MQKKIKFAKFEDLDLKYILPNFYIFSAIGFI